MSPLELVTERAKVAYVKMLQTYHVPDVHPLYQRGELRWAVAAAGFPVVALPAKDEICLGMAGALTLRHSQDLRKTPQAPA